MAAVLGVAAFLKLFRFADSVASLEALGLRSHRVAQAGIVLAVLVEAVLAAGVVLGSDVAAYAAAGLLSAFALGLAGAVVAGKAGAPCPCFGAHSTIGWGAVARNGVLAASFLGLPFLPDVTMGRDGWLAAGLGVALAGIVVLGVAVLALAREVGALRLRLPPDSALEILSEGPEIGERTTLVDRFDLRPRTRFALAVFTSEACRLCRSLAPAVSALARDPLVAVETFDEERDADAWRALEVPGSPYAVAVDRDGTVRAKGTFNTAAQLEAIVAAAERRARAAARV